MKLGTLYSFLSDNTYLLPLGIVVLTILMLMLTLLPSDFMGESKIWSYDKLGHTALFGSWSFTVGLYYQIKKSTQASIWLIFLSGVAFGLLIEILQFLLPLNRHADPVDFLFDVLGCLLAVWLLRKVQPETTNISE